MAKEIDIKQLVREVGRYRTIEKEDEYLYEKAAAFYLKHNYRFDRINVDDDITIDKTKLFGLTINEVINNLKQFDGNLILEEEWDYDDNSIVARHTRPETDEEYYRRIGRELRNQVAEYKDIIEKNKRIDEEIQRLQKSKGNI